MSNNINIYGKLKSKVIGGAVLDEESIVGSYHTVNTLNERNEIPSQLRKAGMAVYVAETSYIYILGTDLTNESWFEFVTFSSNNDTSTIIIPDINLNMNTIMLLPNNDNVLFENKFASYIINSNSINSLIKLYGIVKPSNLPENITIGDNIYINSNGILLNKLDNGVTYKYIGNIIMNNNSEYVLSLLQNQVNYTTK